jgi:hypothetical protein
LKKGHCSWRIEDKDVSGLREMVTELLRRQTSPFQGPSPETPQPPRRIRPTYTKPLTTNTQFLALTPENIVELTQLAEKLGIPEAATNQ